MFSQAELQALRQTISRQVGLNTYENLNLRCLTALERILSHVVLCLDGDRDADINACDLAEVVMDALERAKLLDPVPQADPQSELEQCVVVCRTRVPPGAKMLYALCAGDVEPIPLVQGETLGSSVRAGNVLARLLAADRNGPWYVVAVRDGSAHSRPMKSELDAADRIAAAARLVDVPLAGVFLDIRSKNNNKTHTLVEETDG